MAEEKRRAATSRILLDSFVPVLPMTRNQRDRAHWRVRQIEQNDWHLLTLACPLELFQAPDRPRSVTIIFVKSRGPLSDPDNLVARAKVVLDAIVSRHWLIDDAPQFLELTVHEEIAANAGTRIEISEVTTSD